MENEIIIKIKELCEEKGFSLYKLSKLSGVPYTTVTNMFYKNTMPTLPTLEKFCVAFDITMAQFFSTDNVFIDLTDEQQDVLIMWSTLPMNKKQIAKAYLQGLYGK